MKIILLSNIFRSIGVHLNSMQALQPARWITVFSLLLVLQKVSIYLTPQWHHRSVFEFFWDSIRHVFCHNACAFQETVYFLITPIFFCSHIPHGQFIAPVALCRVTCVHPANFRPYGLGESTNFHWHDNDFWNGSRAR